MEGQDDPAATRAPPGTPAPGRTPVVSVVLPVFNGERYLRQALDSILGQTFADFELIAVDDCSRDGTAAILAEYAARDARVSVHTNPANAGLPASLNNGFARARGDWLCWTSDDNILRPAMLERLLEAARTHPECAIVHSDYRLIDSDGTPGALVRVDGAGDLLLRNTIGCSFLYRRDVDRVLGGYDEALFGVEDYDFWLRAARTFRFFTLHEDLYLYRRHEGSLTSRRARQIHALVAKVRLREIERLPASPRRARALIRLFCDDLYSWRPGLLLRAARDHVPTLVGTLPTIARSAAASLRWRLSRSRRAVD